MYKHSPGRNHRSKGIKVKRTLQICVLLAICFWLIYQIKYSHDKKKAFDESDKKISHKTHVSDEVLKFGRKDLHPRLEETNIVNKKHDEEVEEEETGGGEGGEVLKNEEEEQEEDKKHEEEKEEEEEDNKSEEKEDEVREGGDDEMDEHDQVKTEMEVEGEEDLVEEEKERGESDEKEAEEKDVGGKEGQIENETSLEEHDQSHEAREEQYRADDASSAVKHETEGISAENEREVLENSNGNTEMEMLEGENKANNAEEITVSQNNTNEKAGEVETFDKGILPVAGKEESSEILSFKSEVGNQATEGHTETNNLSLQNETEAQNGTVRGSNSEGSNLQTRQEKNSFADSKNNSPDSNLEISSNTENAEAEAANLEISSNTENAEAEAAMGDSSNSSATKEIPVSEKVIISNESIETEGNIDATQNENSDTGNVTDETDENSVSYSKPEDADEVHHDPIDTSDPNMTLEKDVRTDLDTLPEIRTEGSNDEEAAAE
ncbi:LisH domain-containing protein [Actinidia chinensis var. chinensis]|uniref:LisH domain-containing protein n=1 Tax=Actinidia chinensis var. chinensis TaxID=1590841 RepID=A0A2R6R1Z8_ACTCC|nr:LisH domain-containing protein [Actinidia chinensis var. chinensis]